MISAQELGIKSIEQLKNKRIVVLGFGVEGKSIASYLLDKGIEVSVYDRKNKSDLEGFEQVEKKGALYTNSQDEISSFDIIIRSPGIRLSEPFLEDARKKDRTITSATKLFFDLTPTKKIIGVTGTKGKGTTSSLIYEILKENGEDVYLGGNIGESPFSFIDNLDQDSWVVLEMSSFQLQDLHKSPHIAVMLMTTNEHLDYHKDVYEYIDAKRNIFRFQGPQDFAIVNQDYPASSESDVEGEAATYKVSRENEVFDQGCFVKDGKMMLKMSGNTKEIFDMENLLLPGKHNWENAAAAVIASLLAGADMRAIIPVLKSFKGLSHRIELAATVRGVRYYDDSFSTTPETTIAAIESFDNPKILILGGSSKNSNFSELGEVISNSSSVKAIIGIGEEWKRIKEDINSDSIEIIENCSSMEEIIKEASKIAEVGDVVLLSPACASFDMFKNYKDRGEKFKEEVFGLTN